LLEHAHFFVLCFGLKYCILLSWLVGMIIIINIAIKLPNKYAIALSNCNDLAIIVWIEKYGDQRISVANKALEKIRCSLLCLIVPYPDHAILACTEEVGRVGGDIE